MAFLDQERVDLRRFCGYPIYGALPSGFVGYRFFNNYGLLEFRLTNLSANEEATARALYLTGPNNLYLLEQAVTGSTANLDTVQAAVWTHNQNEVRDRMRLFNRWRKELCGFFGVPPGPNLGDDDSTISLVV